MERSLKLSGSLCPEDRLLLACARVHHDAQGRELVRRLAASRPDWGHLLAMARRHRVLPLLARSLRALAADMVPPEVLAELQAESGAIRRRNLMVTMELVSLLRLFEEQGIRAVPLKGPVLASLAYGDLALRQYSDLDLLLHKQDVLRAKAMLATSGYKPRVQLTASQEDAFIDYQHDYALEHEAKELVIELHSGIKPRFYSIELDHEELWASLMTLPLGGVQVSHLDFAAQFLTLSIHGASHSWERLFWICDIAELLRLAHDVDWERLLSQARRLGCGRLVLLGLALAHDLLDAPLSPQMTRALYQDPTVGRLQRQVIAQLFQAPDETVEGVRQFRFFLMARERWQDRLRYALHLAMDPTINDWSAVMIPAPVAFLYYLVRPVRLLRTQLSRLGRGQRSADLIR